VTHRTQRRRRPRTACTNIGNNQPVELMTYIRTLEECLGKKRELNLLPLQAGDVPGLLGGYRGPDAGRRVHAGHAGCRSGSRRSVDWYQRVLPDSEPDALGWSTSVKHRSELDGREIWTQSLGQSI